MKKRLLSAFLALSMIFSVIPIIPTTALATHDSVNDSNASSTMPNAIATQFTYQFDDTGVLQSLKVNPNTDAIGTNESGSFAYAAFINPNWYEANDGSDPSNEANYMPLGNLTTDAVLSQLDDSWGEIATYGDNILWPIFVGASSINFSSTEQEVVSNSGTSPLFQNFDIKSQRTSIVQTIWTTLAAGADSNYDEQVSEEEISAAITEGTLPAGFPTTMPEEVDDSTDLSWFPYKGSSTGDNINWNQTQYTMTIVLWANGSVSGSSTGHETGGIEDALVYTGTYTIGDTDAHTVPAGSVLDSIKIKLDYKLGTPAAYTAMSASTNESIIAATWTGSPSSIGISTNYEVKVTVEAEDGYTFDKTAVTGKTDGAYTKVTLDSNGVGASLGTITNVAIDDSDLGKAVVTIAYDPIKVSGVQANPRAQTWSNSDLSGTSFTVPTVEAEVTYNNTEVITYTTSPTGGAGTPTGFPSYVRLMHGTTDITSTSPITPSNGDTIKVNVAAANTTGGTADEEDGVGTFSLTTALSAFDIYIGKPAIGNSVDTAGNVGSATTYKLSGTTGAEVTWTDGNNDPATSFNYDTVYNATASLEAVGTGNALSNSATVTFYDKAATSTALTGTTSWNNPDATITFPAIASPTITARSGGDYDYYDGSGAPQTFTLTQADSIFTDIEQVTIEGVIKTKAQNATSNIYYEITGTGATRTLTIKKAFLDAVAEAKLAASGIDAINTGSTPDKWTVTVNFAGNGKAETAAATHITAVNTTPYLTVTNPASGKGDITVSSAADVSSTVKHDSGKSVYKLTKNTDATLTYNNAPAHTTGYKWTVDGTQDASFSTATTKTLSAPSAGARYTASAETNQPTRTITVTFDSAGTGSGKVAITPATALAGSSTSPVTGTTNVTVYADTAVTLTPTADSGSVIRSVTAGTGTAVSGNVGTAAADTTAANITFKFDSKTGVTLPTPTKNHYVASPAAIEYTGYNPGDYTLTSITIGGTALQSADYTVDTATGKITINDTTNVRSLLNNTGTSDVNKTIVFIFDDTTQNKNGTIVSKPASSISAVKISDYEHGESLNKSGATISFTASGEGTYVYTLASNSWTLNGNAVAAGSEPTSRLSVTVGSDSQVSWADFITNYITTPALMYNTTNSIVTEKQKSASTTKGIKNGDTIELTLDGKTDSTTVKVDKATLDLTPSTTDTNSWNKYYDTNSAVKASPTSVSFTTPSQLISGDNVTAGAISITGKYYSGTALALTETSSAVAAGTNYTLQFTASDTTEADAANYNLTVANASGRIRRIHVAVTSIEAEPATIGDATGTTAWHDNTVAALGISGSGKKAIATLTGATSFPTDINLIYSYYYNTGQTASTGTKSNGVTIGQSTDTGHEPKLSDTTNYVLDSVVSPIDGEVNPKSVGSISVTAQPQLQYAYGVAAARSGKNAPTDYSLDLTGMKVTVGSDVYEWNETNKDWETADGSLVLTTSQLTLKWTDTGAAAADDDVLQPRLHNNKTLTVTYTAGTTDRTATTSAITVAQATLVVKATHTGDTSKTYDGTSTVPGTYSYSIDSGVVTRPGETQPDDVALSGSGITAAFKGSTVAGVTYDAYDVVWTAATGGSVTTKPVGFTKTSDDAALTGTTKGNYTIAAIDDDTATLTVNPRPLKVKSIEKVTKANQYDMLSAAGTVTGSNANTGTNDRNLVTYEGETTASEGVISGDKVEVDFTYSYRSSDVNSTSVSASTTYDVDITANSIVFTSPKTGTDNGNYTVATAAPATGTGNIDPVTVTNITLSVPNASYTYIDNEQLNLMGARVSVNFSTPSLNTSYIYGTNGSHTGWYETAVPTDGTTAPIAAASLPFKIRWNTDLYTGTGTNIADAAHDQSLIPAYFPTSGTGTKKTGQLRAIHVSNTESNKSTTASNYVTIEIEKKEIDKVVVSLSSDDIAKVYNNLDTLLDADKAKITLTGSYSGTDVSDSDATITADPYYTSKYYNAAPIDIKFKNLSITSDKFKLASSVKADEIKDNTDNFIKGTIAKRKITIALGNTKYVSDKEVTDNDPTTTLTEISGSTGQYSLSLTDASSANTGETFTLVDGRGGSTSDGTKLTIKGTFPNTSGALSLGNDQHVIIADLANDITLSTTDTANSTAIIASYDITKPSASDYVLGNVTTVTKKLTVNPDSAKGAAKVYKVVPSPGTDTEVSKNADGTYHLSVTENYYIVITPVNPTTAGGYRVDTITDNQTVGTQGAADTSDGYKVKYSFTMPNSDVTATVTFKQNPYWGTPAPGNIDKKDTAGSYSFKYVGDFVPTSLKIGELTYDLAGTDSAYLNTSTKTITIPNSVFNAATALGLGTKAVELEFNDSTTPAPTDNTLNKLTKTITVSNTTTSVTTIAVDTSPTQTGVQKTYGDKLALDGFVFHTKTTKTGETPVINYYYYVDDTNTWKKISKSAETAPTTAEWAAETGGVDLAADSITLAWSDNKADTGLVSGTTVLFNSKHDGNKVKVSWVDVNSATKTAETAAWQVQKATLTFTVTTGTITKTYDGSADIDDSTTTNKDGITVTPNGEVNGDKIDATVKSGTFITSTTDKTANKNQGTNKPIQLLFNLSGDNLAEYKTASVATIGTSTDLEDLTLTGNVSKKTINITDVKIPSVKPSAATDAARTKSVSGSYSTVSPSNLTATGIVTTDSLTFSVTGLYDTPLVEGAKPTFNKTSATAATGIAAGEYFGEVTGTDADNYTWNWATEAEGLVETSQLKRIDIKTQPSQTDNATKAVHGDNLDLKDLVVSLVFEDSSFDRDVPYWDPAKNGTGDISDAWTAEGMTIKLDGNGASNATVLRRDDNNGDPLVISRTGKPAGVADAQTKDLRVDTFTINATVTVSPEKDYDGTNAITGSPAYTITFVNSSSFPSVAGSSQDNVQVSDAEAKLVYSDIHANNSVKLKAASTDSTAYAEFAWKTGTDEKITKNYTIAMDSSQAEQSGKINKRQIDITAIKIDAVDEREDRASELTKSKAAGEAQITASAAPSDFTFNTADGYYSTAGSGDTIDITYSATYTDVTQPPQNKAVAWVTRPNYNVVSGSKGNNDDYLFTFPDDASGKVNPKVLTGLSVDADNMDKSYTHGDPLKLDGLRLELVYGSSQTEYYVYGTNNNADTTKTGWFRVASGSASVPTGTSDNALTGNPPDISLAWSTGADTTVTQDTPVRYDSDRYSLKADNVTKSGRIVVTGATGSDPITRNIDVDVLRKPAKLTISGEVSKIYDGDKALNKKTWTSNTDADNDFTSSLSFDWHKDGSGVSDIISDDIAGMTIKNTDTLANLFFNTKNTDANTLTKSNGNALDRTDLVYTDPAIAVNYDITVEIESDTDKFKAEIKKKQLKVTNVKKPEVIVDDNVSDTVKKIKHADGGYTTNDLIGSEDVEIQYDYTFSSTAVAGTHDLDSTGNAKITYDTVAPGMNYKLVPTLPTEGIVHNKRITLVNITPHRNTKYDHGDALDLTGSVITLAYKDGDIDTETFTYDPDKHDWFNASDTQLPTNVVVDWKTNDGWNGTDTRAAFNTATGFSTTKIQRYDDTDFDETDSHTKTLALYYKNEGGTVQGPIYAGTVEVSQKKLQAVTITGSNFEKTYDATTDATLADQTAAVTDPTNVLVMQHDGTTRDTVEIEITSVAYPSADANVDTANAPLDPATGLYKMQYTLGFKAGSNDNGNYILAVDPKNSSQVTTSITGTIKPRPITFSYAPVTAVVANDEADSPKPVKMSNKTIGDTAENIQINTSVNTMPDEDIAKFRATYNATYSVDHIKNQKNPADPDYLLDVITDSGTDDDPTFTGIKGTNYVFTWPKLTPKLVLNAQSISALTTDYTATFTHGDPLKFGGDAAAGTPALSFEVIYTNGQKAEYTYDTNGWEKTVKVYDDGTSSWTVDKPAAPVSLNDEGITLVWASTGDEVADNDPVLMYEHTDIANGKRADKIRIHALSSTVPNGFVYATTGDIIIKPKDIYVKAEATDELDKIYDSKTEIEDADRPHIKFTFYTDAAGTQPYTTATATTADVDKIRIKDKTDNASGYWTAEYYDNTASKTTKHVNWQGGTYKGTVDPWDIKLSNIDLTGDPIGTTGYTYADSYNLVNKDEVIGENALRGKINPREIDVEITNTAVEPIFVDTPAGERTGLKLPANPDHFVIKAIENDKVSGDVVYNYPNDTTPSDSVAITDDGTPTSPLQYVQGTTGNSDGNNYLYKLVPNNVFGQIKKIVVSEISVTTSPETNYTHGDTLSLKDMVVHTKQNDGKEVDYIYIDDGTNKGWAVKKTEATPTYDSGDILAADKVPFTYDTWENGDGRTGEAVTPPINDTMTHSGQDKSKIKVIALDEDGHEKPSVSATTATISVASKEIFVAVSVKESNDPLTGEAYKIVKIYNKNAAIESDANGTANISKLKYDLKTLKADGVSYEDFEPITYTDEGGNTHTEQVTYDATGAKGVFVASESDDTENPYVQLIGGAVPLSANDNSDVAEKRVIISGVGVKGADVDNGNYTYTTATYDLKGTILKREVKVKPAPQGYETITSTTKNGDPVNIVTWGLATNTNESPFLSVGDDKDADYITVTWKGTYDNTADPSIVAVAANSISIANAAGSGKTRADNYILTNDAENLTVPSSSVKEVAATGLEITGQPKFVTESTKEPENTQVRKTHGDTLGNSDWDGLEFKITWDDDKTTYHKLKSDGTWDTDSVADAATGTKYTDPADNPKAVSFAWNGGAASTNTLPASPIARKDKDNQLSISVVDEDGAPITKTTDKPNVDPKQITVKLTGNYTKPYDGNANIPNQTVTLDKTQFAETDRKTSDPTVSVPVKFVAGAADKRDQDVEIKAGSNPVEYSKTVALASDNLALTGEYASLNDCYKLVPDITDFKGAIEPKELKVKLVIPGRSNTDETTFTVNDDENFTSEDKVGGDTVKIGYTGTYTKPTATGEVAVAVTDLKITSDDNAKDNYAIKLDGEPKVTVTIPTNTNTGGGGGGGGGGSVNTLTVHYKNEDGTAGDDVSSIYAPLGTDPIDLMGVFKQKIKDQTVIWTSSDESVATVDENGHVTFVGEGTATITAQSKTTKSLKDTVQITISPTPVAPTMDPNDPNNQSGTATPTPRPVYEKTDSLITKTMLNPYIVGYDDYVFGPELPISREELATIFARLIANDLYMDQAYDTSFPDVPEKWSKPYIGYLEGFNVVTGYEDGNFRPENYITRAEMAVMMAKAEGYNLDGFVSAEDTGFPDMDEGYSTWAAAKAIKILTDMGIMQGYPDGTFKPGQPITRAETVATVNRVLADMEVADYEVLPSDVTDAHWAYNDIVFAMNHRVLKDAAADPQRFIWSEQFDENMIINTERVEGETVKVGEETPADGDAENKEETSDSPDATAAENKEDTSESDNAQTTE